MSEMKDWTMVVRFSVRAEDEEEALDRWAEGDYEAHEILSCELDKPAPLPPVHIVYYFKEHVLYYRNSDGGSGATLNEDEEEFRRYWKKLYCKNGREVTFEKI